MADQNGVGAVGIELAVGLIGDLERRQIDPAIQPQRAVRPESAPPAKSADPPRACGLQRSRLALATRPCCPPVQHRTRATKTDVRPGSLLPGLRVLAQAGRPRNEHTSGGVSKRLKIGRCRPPECQRFLCFRTRLTYQWRAACDGTGAASHELKPAERQECNTLARRRCAREIDRIDEQMHAC